MYQIFNENENITQKISDAFLSNPRKVGVIIQSSDFEFTTEHVIECNIEEGIITQDKFVFGTANVSVAEITLNNIGNRINVDALEKQEIKVYYTIEVDGTIYKVPMGVFVVDTATEDANIISISAYDRLILSEENYNLKTELTYPVTLKGIVQDACNISKISYDGKDFFNSGLQLNDMVVFETDNTCRNILQNVAELACSYIRCNKDGFITMVNLNDNNPKCNITPNNYFKFKKNENIFGPVQSVRIARDETIELFGEGSPQFQIDDNYFLPKDFAYLPELLYNNINHITYMPADLEFQGNPLIEPGDFIQVTDKNNVHYTLLVTSMKYSYNGSLRCVLNSISNSEMSLATEKKNIVSESVEGLNKRVNELKQLVDKKLINTVMTQLDQFNNRIDGLKEELKEVEIKVTPDGIVNTVTNSKKYTDIIDGIYDGLNGLAGQTVNVESLIAQYADKINMSVKKGNIISEINLDTSGVQIRGDKIKLTGMVTFEDLKGEGQTIINGSNITTGTLSGDRIYGGTIEAVNFKGDIVDVMAGLSISPAANPTLGAYGYLYPDPNKANEWSTITFKQKTGDPNSDNTFPFDAVKLKVYPYYTKNSSQTPNEYSYGLEITGAIKAKDDITIEGQNGLNITGSNGLISPIIKTDKITSTDYPYRKYGLTIGNFKELIPYGSINAVEPKPYIYVEQGASTNEEEQRPQLYLTSDKHPIIKSMNPDKYPSLRVNNLYIDGYNTPAKSSSSIIYTNRNGIKFVTPYTDGYQVVIPVPVYASEFITEVNTLSKTTKTVQAVMTEDGKKFITGGNLKTINNECIIELSDVISRDQIVSVIVTPNQQFGKVWWDVDDTEKVVIRSDNNEVKFSYMIYSSGGNING